MPDSSVIPRLVASIRALLPEHWQGRAGEHFRQTMKAASDFARENDLAAEALAQEAVSLGRMKIEGLAAKELASALRDFSDAEEKAVSARFEELTLDSKVRKEEAEARLAELKVVEAEIDLLAKLKAAGVVLRYDSGGKLTVLPSEGCDLTKMKPRELKNPDE